MTGSKAIYPPLHDLLFVHQLSGGQIKSLVGELELKKVVGQKPQAQIVVQFRLLFYTKRNCFSMNHATCLSSPLETDFEIGKKSFFSLLLWKQAEIALICN